MNPNNNNTCLGTGSTNDRNKSPSTPSLMSTDKFNAILKSYENGDESTKKECIKLMCDYFSSYIDYSLQRIYPSYYSDSKHKTELKHRCYNAILTEMKSRSITNENITTHASFRRRIGHEAQSYINEIRRRV
jgi:hypothetical protein